MLSYASVTAAAVQDSCLRLRLPELKCSGRLFRSCVKDIAQWIALQLITYPSAAALYSRFVSVWPKKKLICFQEQRTVNV